MKKKIASQINKVIENTILLKKSGFLDSESYYNLTLSRLFIENVFDEKGKFLFEVGDHLINIFPQNFIHQRLYHEHVKLVWHEIKHNKQLQIYFARLSLPISSEWMEQVIRMSLGKDSVEFNSIDVKRAVLCALLFPIRQSIGSCFATAPAIFIQRHQLPLMVKDLLDLLSIGQLRRSHEEKEIRIPVGGTTGYGLLDKKIMNLENFSMHIGWIQALEKTGKINASFSLKEKIKAFRAIIHEANCIMWSWSQLIEYLFQNQPENKEKVVSYLLNFSELALSKVWEYTIASFVDTDNEFSSMTLTMALGINHQESLGIGEKIYHILQDKLDIANENIDKLNEEVYIAHQRVKLTQRLLGNADSEAKIRRLKNELQMHQNQLYQLSNEREDEASHAKEYSEFFSFLLDQIKLYFKLYFQEVFDPNLVDQEGSIFEDRSAGFRLAYKHGRADPNSWTLIDSPSSFIACMQDFFSSIELLIQGNCEWEKGREEIQSIFTELIHGIDDETFMENALERFKRLSTQYIKGRKVLSLWEFISGGTIDTLVKNYFSMNSSASKKILFPNSPQELCIYLIDLMKELPFSFTEACRENAQQGLLIHSPYHVFLFTPGHPYFILYWDNSYFTYTWIRDHYTDPVKQFYMNSTVNESKQLFILKFIQTQAPYLIKDDSINHAELSFLEFAKNAFFQHPFLNSLLFEASSLISKEQFQKHFQEVVYPFEQDLIFLTDIIDFLVKEEGYEEKKLIDFFVQQQLLPPRPLVFADSNWEETIIGFCMGPLSKEIELWKLSRNTLKGNELEDWIDQNNKKDSQPWGVFINNQEFIMDLSEIRMRR